MNTGWRVSDRAEVSPHERFRGRGIPPLDAVPQPEVLRNVQNGLSAGWRFGAESGQRAFGYPVVSLWCLDPGKYIKCFKNQEVLFSTFFGYSIMGKILLNN